MVTFDVCVCVLYISIVKKKKLEVKFHKPLVSNKLLLLSDTL